MNYLIVGDSTSELIYGDLVDEIKKETPNILQKNFDAGQKEIDLFFQSISINSMFGGKELIVLKRAEKIDKIWNFLKVMNNFNIMNKDIIIIYNLTHNSFSNKLSVFPAKAKKEIGGNFKLIEVEDKDGKTTVNYIMKTLVIDQKTAVKFKEMVGDDLHTLSQEMKKVRSFLGEEVFTFEKVAKILSISKEYNTFDLVKEILGGKKNNSLEYLEKSKEHVFLLTILMNEFLTLLKLRILFEEGTIKSTRNYNTFKVVFDKNKELFRTKKGFSHPYGVFLKLPLIEKFDSIILQQHLETCLEIDSKFKSGQGELDIMLETFILKI
ncbi:MAG: hypothetical protein KAH04_06660 [Psychrilyobacter sp.]|nr:hypothetical protein [Psychrilyobacter sp.]